MKKLILLSLGCVAVISTISCGGDGEAKSFSKTALILQNVERLVALSAADSGVSPSTGNQAGLLPSVGRFVRHFGGPAGIGPAMLQHALKPGLSPATAGGQNLRYDDHLQLWMDTQWSDKTFTSKLYLDQSKTKPAGEMKVNYAGPANVFPQTYTAEYKLTAGPLSGSKGSYSCTLTSLLHGSIVFSDTFADGSHDKGSSHWSEASSTWQMKWDGPPNMGSYQAKGSWAADGTGTSTYSGTDGFASTWKYKTDGSGSAHIEGNDPKLPAELAWTGIGEVKATYGDSTTEDWSRNDIWTSIDGTSAISNLITAPAAATTQAAADVKAPDKK